MIKNKKLLIAEDSIFNQMFIEEFVKLLGYDYTFANNGSEAIALLEKEDFDLILMDIEMPLMDGILASKQIRSEFPYPKNQIPIIALTAYKEVFSKEELAEVGINDFILKPFTYEKFFSIINTVLEKNDETFEAKDINNHLPISSLYNLDAINEFSGNDQAFVRDMVFHFIQKFPQFIQKLLELEQISDFEHFKKEIQKFKPTFLLLGIQSLNREFELLEEMANSQMGQVIVKKHLLKIEKSSIVIIQKLKDDFKYA